MLIANIFHFKNFKDLKIPFKLHQGYGSSGLDSKVSCLAASNFPITRPLACVEVPLREMMFQV